jgi:hypothetical protein
MLGSAGLFCPAALRQSPTLPYGTMVRLFGCGRFMPGYFYLVPPGKITHSTPPTAEAKIFSPLHFAPALGRADTR